MAIQGTVPVGGSFAPTDVADSFGTHNDKWGVGGYRIVKTIADRDIIPVNESELLNLDDVLASGRRKLGMMVYVSDESKLYVLTIAQATWDGYNEGQQVTALADNANWIEFSGGGGTQTLQEVLTEGNEATGINIKLINDTAIELDNGSLLRKGTYNFGNFGDIIISDITDAGTGLISWRDITGIKWSDLNGTYVKTAVAVTPTGYTTPNLGMHTPVTGTYNYYLQLLGNPGLNGIAYFLAPGNRSGWGADPDDDANTDPPVTYWRLCVLSDWPITYFTNPSTDAYNFPFTGWVPVDDTIPTNEGGEGYDYISTYDTGFTATFVNILNGSGGISRICSIGYEDMWQAGIRYTFSNSGTIREATNCFNYIPDNTFDVNKRFVIGSRWILDNGDVYICKNNDSNAAVWSLETRSTGFEQNFLLMGG